MFSHQILGQLKRMKNAYLNEANIYQSLGDFNKAENALIKCINLDQKAFRALFLLTIQKRSSKSKIFEEYRNWFRSSK